MQSAEALLRAEEACISWAMGAPKATLEHGIEADWFSDGRCRKAWEALQGLAREGYEPDWTIVEVLAERMQAGELVAAWLTQRQLLAVLEQPNWRYWSGRMRELHTARRRSEAAADLASALRKSEDEGEREGAVAGFMRAMAELPTAEADDPMTLHDVGKAAVRSLGERLDASARGEAVQLTVPTGFSWLDGKTGGGWPRSLVSVLAGRTSHGKSTVAQIAAIAASRAGFGVHYFCLEDGAAGFGARLVAQIADLSVGDNFANRCKDPGRVTAEMSRALERGASRRFLFETKRLPVEQLIARVDRYRTSNRTDVVFVDYLSLIPLPGRSEKHQEVDQVMTRLQEAAIEQGVAYVVLHQLNRTYAGRQNKQPMLSDLRDSGAIEERAATVVFAYRPNVDEGADQSGVKEVDDMDLILGKNKFGPKNCMTRLRMDFAHYRVVGAP